MPDERWRPIPEYKLLGIPPGYEASNCGRIRSIDRILRTGRTSGGVVLKQQEDKDGYWTVNLSRKRVRVNVVVLLAFQGLPESRHLDDDRKNNRPENLAWGSRLRNERDKRKEKREKETDGMERGYCPSPLESPPVTPVTPWVTLAEAVEMGIVSGTLGALRIARHRGQLPEPWGVRGTASLYSSDELVQWDAERGGRHGL